MPPVANQVLGAKMQNIQGKPLGLAEVVKTTGKEETLYVVCWSLKEQNKGTWTGSKANRNGIGPSMPFKESAIIAPKHRES